MDDSQFGDEYMKFKKEMEDIKNAAMGLNDSISLFLVRGMMKMSDEERNSLTKEMSEIQLKHNYAIALENEFFEVCQAIKEELDLRNVKVT